MKEENKQILQVIALLALIVGGFSVFGFVIPHYIVTGKLITDLAHKDSSGCYIIGMGPVNPYFPPGRYLVTISNSTEGIQKWCPQP